MENYNLDIRNILEVIFRTTKKRGNILADSYLIKDPSIISKWKNSKTQPTNEDIIKIVEFAYEESTETQRKIMRNEITNLINNSYLKGVIRSSLISIEDFKEFLSEVLKLVTVVLGKEAHYEEIGDGSLEINESNGIEGIAKNTIEMETITAFSEGIEGKYSGVIEFNMSLSKDRGERYVGRLEKDVKNKSDNDINKENMPRKLQKKLKASVVFGTLLVVVSAFLAVNAATNGQPENQKAAVSGENTYNEQKNAEITPRQSQKPKDKASDNSQASDAATNPKNTGNPALESKIDINDVGSKISSEVIAEPKVNHEQDKNEDICSSQKSNVTEGKESRETKNDTTVNDLTANDSTANDSTTNNTTTNNTNTNNTTTNNTTTNNTTTNNTTTNNTDNSTNNTYNTNNTITDGDVIIFGDHNKVGKGNNISINIE